MSLTLTKTPTNSRVSLRKPSSYAVHVTSPLVPYIYPLFIRDEDKALVALDDVAHQLAGSGCRVWLISPTGQLMDSRPTA